MHPSFGLPQGGEQVSKGTGTNTMISFDAEKLPRSFLAFDGADEAEPLSDHHAALEESGWQPDALAEHLPGILAKFSELPPWQRASWQAGLRRAWQQLEGMPGAEDWDGLFDLAAAWSDWTLLCAMADWAGQGARLDDGQALKAMVGALHQGRTAWALDLGLRRQLASPDNDDIGSLHRYLLDWQDYRAGLPWSGNAEDAGAELALEPLGHHHAEDFAWQCQSPDIVELCCLPVFDDARQWHQWLDRVQSGNQFAYAILHRTWGFIGSVHLAVHRDCGFLYYWIGEDFRGCGFAAKASSLLLGRLKPVLGLNACHAKVFECNVASRRTLENIGFRDTDVRAAPPWETEAFYRLGPPIERASLARELHGVMTAVDRETLVAIPVWG